MLLKHTQIALLCLCMAQKPTLNEEVTCKNEWIKVLSYLHLHST